MSKYFVVTAQTYLELQFEVSKFLNDGWKLAGGISTWANGFMQAIYKDTEKEENDRDRKKNN